MTKRITVGLPVYRAAKFIPAALACLQQQTFREFDAIISVDGDDRETAGVPTMSVGSSFSNGHPTKAARLVWKFQLAVAAGSKRIFLLSAARRYNVT